MARHFSSAYLAGFLKHATASYGQHHRFGAYKAVADIVGCTPFESPGFNDVSLYQYDPRISCPGATGRQQAKRASTLAGILSTRRTRRDQSVLEVASTEDPAFVVYTKNEEEANDLVGCLHG